MLKHLSQDPKQQKKDFRKLKRTLQAGTQFKTVHEPYTMSMFSGVYLYCKPKSSPYIILMTKWALVAIEQEGFELNPNLSCKLTDESVKASSKAKTLNEVSLRVSSTETTGTFASITGKWDSMITCKTVPEKLGTNCYLKVESLYQVMRAVRSIFPGKYERNALALDIGTTDISYVRCFRVTSQPGVHGLLTMNTDRNYKVHKALENEAQL